MQWILREVFDRDSFEIILMMIVNGGAFDACVLEVV